MSDRKYVYLSGRLQGCTQGEAQGWRNVATKLLGENHVHNPDVKKDYVGMTDDDCVDLVNADLDAIEGAVAVLLNAWSPGWGSGCELAHACEAQVPVVVVATGDISPWLRAYATHIVPTVEEGCKWITVRFGLDSPIVKVKEDTRPKENEDGVAKWFADFCKIPYVPLTYRG